MNVQRTDEWFAERCGKATASRIADVIAQTKTGWGASRYNYRAELVAERLTGIPQGGYQNAAMMWGVEHEDEAVSVYGIEHDALCEEVGFVPHPSIPMSGASPDRLVGEDGLLEVKCPNTATHIETLLTGKVADKYIVQMQWQLACTGRQWCDFASYDPRMPADLSLWVKRIERDDGRIGDLERAVEAFLSEVDEKVEALKALRPGYAFDLEEA